MLRSLALVLPLLIPAIAHAGMAGLPTLTELARLRLENISFFLVLLLVIALVVKLLWNSLRGDFPPLPRLSYGRSCALVAIWGLLFILVLAMISGARELLTPGAWEKAGATYRLADPSASGGGR